MQVNKAYPHKMKQIDNLWGMPIKLSQHKAKQNTKRFKLGDKWQSGMAAQCTWPVLAYGWTNI